ncbi:MAG TPA: antitoxin VapB family protein [Candidatus Lokiarchaeia archaeon]|nr:antitoxin VapB family protein [Candidatus Lokiarchaeia archaeon]
MTQKTISLPQDVYNRLKQLKDRDESYGDLLMRLINEHEKKPGDIEIESFASAFDDKDSDDWGEIERIIYQKRRFSSSRDVKLDDS